MSNSKNNSASFLLLLLGAVLLGVTGCKEPGEGNDLSFDQTALLTNLGANIIAPNYQDLNTSLARLESSAEAFSGELSETNLEALREEFIAAYKAWMHCSTFEFGPASDRSLRAQVNIFPTDVTVIEANITSGSYDLAQASNLDAKGLPALDYLLHGVGGEASAVLGEYTDPNRGPALLNYLDAVVADLISSVEGLDQTWTSTYQTTFVENLGTDVGSSMGQFVNEFNYDYEILKKPRLGIPLGVQTLGTPLPEKAEGYYSGISVDLMVEHFDAISNLYFGRSKAGVDGYGLHEAITDLEANYNGQPLGDAISDQINLTRSALAAIPSPFAETVVNDPTLANAAYTEVQKLVVLFKTDMTSSLGILITYVDNDGD